MFRILLALFLAAPAFGQTSQSTLDAAKAATQSFSKVKNQSAGGSLSLCTNDSGTERCMVQSSTGAVTIGSPTSNTTLSHLIQGGTNEFELKSLSTDASSSLFMRPNGTGTSIFRYLGTGNLNIRNASNVTHLDVTQSGVWSFGSSSLATGTMLVSNNDSSQNPAIGIDNWDSTPDSNTVMLRIRAPGSSGATGARLIKFGDSDTTEIGAIIAAGVTSVAYNTSSDARLKENIKPMMNALSRTLQLRPSSFNWKEGGQYDEGFIAQEVQKVYPFAVSGKPSDSIETPMMIDYGKLTPLLAAAIQELAEENRKLRERLDAAGL